MVPEKSNGEWKKLITGENPIEFSSFALQMTVSRLAMSYKDGKVSMDDAVEELHKMCLKYKNAVSKDLMKIFNI